MNQIKILIVEDEAIAALELKMRLQSKGFKYVTIVSSGEQAIKLVDKTKFNLILMDVILSGKIDGIETAKKISTHYQIPIIYITGNTHYKTDERLVATRPFDVLIKPVTDWKLFEVIEQALTNWN